MLRFSADAVFTSYYLHNPPGGFFSMPIFLSLLWALLKAGMVSDILSILNVSIPHKIAVSVRLRFHRDVRPPYTRLTPSSCFCLPSLATSLCWLSSTL